MCNGLTALSRVPVGFICILSGVSDVSDGPGECMMSKPFESGVQFEKESD